MPSFKIIGLLVLEKTILKVFNIYRHGGHLSHVTWTIYITFCSTFPRRLHIKFGFDWLSGVGEEDVSQWWTDGLRQMDAGARGIL